MDTKCNLRRSEVNCSMDKKLPLFAAIVFKCTIFFSFQLILLLVLLTSVTHHVCSKAEKKIQFCNRNCGISYIFMNPSYFRFSFPLLLFFFFWILGCKAGIVLSEIVKKKRAWKIPSTIIWKKYSSINKNESGVKNLKTYWLYLWSENNYNKKKIEIEFHNHLF